MAIYNEDIFSLFNEYNSSQNGIKSNSVVDRQNRYGINVLDKQKKDSFIKKFLLQFKNIMIIILFLSAIISSVLAIINKDSESLFEGLFIFLVVIFNAIVGVVQEQKAENALEMLKKSTEPFATIIRDNKQQKINIADLVVGDIILLKAGNFVPADIRLIESKNLKCNESSITGESIAVSKNSDTLKQNKLNISEQSNMCFSGTTITEGSGKGIIVAVGKNTELGKISKILNTSIKEKTPLEKEIDKIGKTLTFGILMIVFVVFIVQIFFNKSSSILDSLLTAISLAVAAIPESLPAVITLIMAMGVQKLAKKNAIIKKLSSVETLGCCNIICSDKTGTLTKNEMSISHIYLNNKLSHYKDFDIKENLKFCQIASTCNNITINDNKIIGDATETSIIKFLKSNNINISILKNQFPTISENEFSSTKKQMRLLCKNQNTQILFAKGAIDYLIKDCSKILIDNQEHSLTDKQKSNILSQNENICKLGERVIAFAYKDNAFSTNESDLTLVGFVGIIDPPKLEVFESIKKCKNAGLEVLMITGDHPTTAFAIAKNLSISKNKNEVITGQSIDNLTDIELVKTISNYKVFARVTPEHKLRIVNALKARKNIVAMTGDGINDAPSIKSANIGISMGITGTDVTKEVSDIIISDDKFSTIVLAIEEGRTIYKNITKTIIFLISTNLVEVLGIFITSLIMKQSIFLLPTQILFINLITDSLPAFALGIEPSEKNIMNTPPRNPNKSLLFGKVGSLIIYEGFIQSLAVLIMFIFSTHQYGNIVSSTMVFLTICLMQIIHAINCKTEKSIFSINIFKNKFFNFSFIFSLGLILGVYCNPFLANIFNLTSLNYSQWLYVILTSISIIPLVEIGKKFIK